MKAKSFFSIALFLLATDVYAGLLFTYHKLALKDLDQMNELVSGKIKESKKSYSGKAVPLKEALQAVLGRPDEDGMVDKVMPPLKAELEAQEAWEKSLRDLTQEAINALKNPKNFKPDVQVTYQIFLENLIGQLKPMASGGGFEHKLIERIRDGKIELSKEAQKERQLRMMKATISPSEIADLILKAPAAVPTETKPAEPAAPAAPAADEPKAEPAKLIDEKPKENSIPSIPTGDGH